jgi:hypothetical protein
MPKAVAVLVGLRKVDATAYGGWDGANGCWGCEQDVDNIAGVLGPLGYQVTVLKTENATRSSVTDALRAATELEEGDIFVFYYSGHGGQQPDQTGPQKDELDGQDETLVLYDGELRDDSLNEIWLNVKSGVRLLMLSDSCNSGSNYKTTGTDITTPTPLAPVDAKAALRMQGQLIHLGGCRDSTPSVGYAIGGLFTIALCTAWESGKFEGDYAFLHATICKLVTSERPSQQPVYNEYGPVTSSFRGQKPFQV